MCITHRRDFLETASALLAAAMGSRAVDVFARQEVLRVGGVHQFPIGEVGWETQQALGWKAMESAFPGKVKVTAVTDVVQAQDAERVFRELASQGHKLIFGTTFSQMAPMVKVARSMPHTTFECCAAAAALKNPRLDGCAMYASGQPCPMCLSAMHMIGIKEVYFAYSNDDAEKYGLSTARIYSEIAKPPSQQSIRIEYVPVRDDGEDPYQAWKRTSKA